MSKKGIRGKHKIGRIKQLQKGMMNKQRDKTIQNNFSLIITDYMKAKIDAWIEKKNKENQK